MGKWLKRILLGLVALLAVAVGTVYAWSHLLLNRHYEPEPRSIAWTEDPAELARGERLAQVYGCFHGCHGADMEGRVFFEEPLFGRAVAPNLTLAVRNYTAEQFEAMVRQGIRPDGTGLFGMPSASFATLSDRDLGAIYSFIASYPQQETPELPERTVGPAGRLFLVLGEFPLPPEEIDDRPWPEERLRDPVSKGAYLAQNACSECHGLELEGNVDFGMPPLAIAKAYDRERFGRLMATGVGLDESRDLGLMALVAEYRFAHFTEDEVDALFAFLQSR